MQSARVVDVRDFALRKELFTALLVSSLCAFVLVAGILLVRRVAGAFAHPLGGMPLLALTACGLLLASGWRIGWMAKGRAHGISMREIMQRQFWAASVPAGGKGEFALVPLAIPGILLFVLLCVLHLPGTPSWGLMLAWLAFLVCETGWWWLAYLGTKRPLTARGAGAPSRAANRAEAAVISVDEMEIEEDALPEAVFQQITRSREGDIERIAVILRVTFAAGQRVAVQHVAFCPPLANIPDVALEVMDGPSATLTLTALQTYGLRLEARLDEPPDEPCVAVVEIIGAAKGLEVPNTEC